MKLRYDKGDCSGCRLCASICAFIHDRSFNPRHGRIIVVKDEPDVDYPIVCRQCENPKCAEACPTGAIFIDAEYVNFQEDRCDACGLCADACPFGAISLHPLTGKALKCDMCGGEAVCAEYCPAGVLEVV